MARFGFALAPRWLLSHLFVVALIATMVSLGFWQIRRLDERTDLNSRVELRMEEPVAPLDDVVTDVPADEQEYRRVELRGGFDGSRQVYHGNRSRDGVTGVHVLTVFDLDDGGSVLVNRGFLPRAVLLQGAENDWSPPPGPVVGLVLESRSGGTVVTSREGYDEVNRVDTDRLGEHLGVDLGSVYVQQLEPLTDAPQVLDPPDRGNGPHLSYAVQWFIFATIGIIGYGLVLRRIAGDRAGAGSSPGEPPESVEVLRA